MKRSTKPGFPHDLSKLARGAAGGDINAFAALVRETQGYAYALAFRLLRDEQDTLDVVQEAFVKVWKGLNGFDPHRAFTTWLYTIVTNCSLDHLRARKRRTSIFSMLSRGDQATAHVSSHESSHNTEEMTLIIKTLADDLPPTQRLVFVLRDLQDCSIEETMEATGLSEASVKTNLHYARRKIRENLVKGHYVEER